MQWLPQLHRDRAEIIKKLFFIVLMNQLSTPRPLNRTGTMNFKFNQFKTTQKKVKNYL
jgi:hypothetical protein